MVQGRVGLARGREYRTAPNVQVWARYGRGDGQGWIRNCCIMTVMLETVLDPASRTAPIRDSIAGPRIAPSMSILRRFDAIGGGLDFSRWPVTDEGTSLFWAGLNKGKRSIQLDLRNPEGRELVAEIITAPGPEAGIFLSNFPETGWLSDEALRARREDLIYVNIIGNPDESTAVDYTVNPSSGFAYATGPDSCCWCRGR